MFLLILATYPALTEGSLVQIWFSGIPKLGVIRWIGYHDSHNEKLAGLEMVVSLPFNCIFFLDHEVFYTYVHSSWKVYFFVYSILILTVVGSCRL